MGAVALYVGLGWLGDVGVELVDGELVAVVIGSPEGFGIVVSSEIMDRGATGVQIAQSLLLVSEADKVAPEPPEEMGKPELVHMVVEEPGDAETPP